MARSLADVAVNTCLRINSDDKVTIFFSPHTTELAEDLADECHKKGADVLLDAWTDRYYYSFMTRMSVESLRQPSIWCRELTRNATAAFWVGGIYDPAVFRKIPPEKMSANNEAEYHAHYPLAQEKKLKSLGIGLASVTKPRAKAYGFNFRAWGRVMNGASTVDFDSLSKRGKELASVLQASSKIKITSPNGTNLRLSVRGRKPRVNDGMVDDQDLADGAIDASIPAGSVYTSVIEDSANGKVIFDVPTAWAGRTIRKLAWTFENGRVVAFDGDQAAQHLKKNWDSSSGDKDRIAGLSIGLNPKAKYGFLINDLVQGSVAIGIGGNEDVGGMNKPGFYHSQVLSDATFEIDGRAIVKQGRLAS
jgi:leucyl aminopeptidase (aminopeptidase T)